MGPAVWILLLCAVPGILSYPTHQAKWNFKRSLFRKLRQSTDNCRQLSETFGSAIQHSALLPNSMVAVVTVVTEQEAEQLVHMLFGFDIVNDNAARDQYTCAITQSQTLSQLKHNLEVNDFLPNVFRFMYDVFSIALRIKLQYTPASASRTLWDSMESAGILGLDQPRLDVLADIIDFPNYPRNYTPAVSYSGSNSAKCSLVTNAFMAVIQEALARQNARDPLRAFRALVVIETVTGIDVTDRSTMRNLFCDLVDGSTRGIRGLYDAFDNNGVLASLIKYAYPYVQIYVPIGRQSLEMIISQHEATPPPSNNNQYYAYYNQVVSQYYGIQEPTNQQPVSRGVGQHLPSELLEAARLALEFLRELEASNLLRLPNDL